MLQSLLRAYFIALVCAGAVLCPSLASAKPQKPGAESKTSATGAVVIEKTFSDMGAGKDPLRLNTWQSGYVLKLPMSPREILTGVRLRLSTVNSTALIRSRSELSIRVNGHILAQYPLDPVDTMKTREVDIPVEWLKPGYNDVFFNVVQHYTYECEDPSSPELWTEINPLQSSVTMEFAGLRPNYQPRLSQLHIAFDRRGWIERPLAVISGTEHVSELQMAAASLVTQGLALRLGFRPLKVEVFGASTAAAVRPGEGRIPGVSGAVIKGKDVLLVGRRAELSRYLDSELHELLSTGPFVGIIPIDNGQSFALIVSGNTDEDVMRAARSLAEPSYKFSDVPMETIKEQWGFEQQPLAIPAKDWQFARFGYRTSESRGVKVQPITFEFRAPADYGAKKGDLITLKLHFSYGAGLRKDSSLNVKLNGQFAVAVALNEPSGAEFQRYEVKVPAQFVTPGYNQLVFEAIFLQHKDRCDMVRDEGLVLTIYEDSTIELPSPTVPPKAPDLKRFSQGFWPLEDKLRVYVTGRETQTASAALETIAALAQKNRAPFEMELKYSAFEAGHMLVVGPHGSMADYVADALPLKRYTWTAEGSHAAWLQAVDGPRVITAFVANDPATLQQAQRILDGKGLWKGIAGMASIIDVTEQSLISEPADKVVEFGRASNLSVSVSNWRSMLLWALALAAAFALTFVAILRRVAQKRHAQAGTK